MNIARQLVPRQWLPRQRPVEVCQRRSRHIYFASDSLGNELLSVAGTTLFACVVCNGKADVHPSNCLELQALASIQTLPQTIGGYQNKQARFPRCSTPVINMTPVINIWHLSLTWCRHQAKLETFGKELTIFYEHMLTTLFFNLWPWRLLWSLLLWCCRNQVV